MLKFIIEKLLQLFKIVLIGSTALTILTIVLKFIYYDEKGVSKVDLILFFEFIALLVIFYFILSLLKKKLNTKH